jgi:hypothetical protein
MEKLPCLSHTDLALDGIHGILTIRKFYFTRSWSKWWNKIKWGGITEEWVKENLGLEGVYCGGAEELQIVWLPVGTAFMIGEYNGAESLMPMGDLVIIA